MILGDCYSIYIGVFICVVVLICTYACLAHRTCEDMFDHILNHISWKICLRRSIAHMFTFVSNIPTDTTGSMTNLVFFPVYPKLSLLQLL